jgi:hypothetical protein
MNLVVRSTIRNILSREITIGLHCVGAWLGSIASLHICGRKPAEKINPTLRF